MALGRERNSRRLSFFRAIMAAALAPWRRAVTAFHTVAFVGQMLPGPLKLQRWLTPEPIRTTTTFSRHDGASDEADIYLVPDGKPRAALLIFIGAGEHGTEDPEVVRLGQALARTGFAVMFYWSRTMGLEARLDVGDVANVVSAFEHLSQQPFVDPNRIGLAGFSVGASYAMVAAADPRISRDIAFINSFGGYFDAADLLVQIAAGRIWDETTETPWKVDEFTEKVFANTVSARASSDAVDAFLKGADSITEARRLYDALPAAFRSDVGLVSPSRHIGDWNGATILRIMHDRGDAVIPATESRRLVAALQRDRPDIEVRYTETDIFRHVVPDESTNWKLLATGAWQVCRHMYHIIAVARQPAD